MEEEYKNKFKIQSEMEKTELNLLSEDRTNFKLSLRKRKYDDILAKKRNIPKKNNISSRPYELFLSKLKLPSNYKLIFSKDDELISTAFKNMKSNIIEEVIYGVCLIKNYLDMFLDDVSVLNKLNINFVSDMLNLLEKWCEKRNLTIIYNILYILTDYSYINEDNKISKILLSSKGYRIWELCFDLQDYEIMNQMVWILQNITYKNSESTYNLIKSNFFKNKIFSFYSNGTILQHLNEKDPENIFYLIIQCGLSLFSNLISIQFPSTFDEMEKNKLIEPVFDLLLKYSQSNSEKIYHTCIYAIALAVEEELDFINKIDNNNNNCVNIIYDILSKKFFSNENLVLQANRILGNYISNKTGLSDEFFDQCIQYEFDIFFGIKLSVAKRETYWVLSNILADYPKAGLIICLNELFINQTFYKYQNTVDVDDLYNIAYFLNSLIHKCDIQNFIKIQEKGIVNITMKYAKMTFNSPKALITIFELIESLLSIGDSVRDNFMGRNLTKEKFDECGLEEVLEKYEDSKNEDLFDIIDKIKINYYNA